MARTFNDISETLEWLSGELASIRGEVLAARVLATFALREAVGNSADPRATLADIHRTTIASLKNVEMDSPGDWDLGDRQITQAVQRCEETFAELSRVLRL